jgi:hypothetical protein
MKEARMNRAASITLDTPGPYTLGQQVSFTTDPAVEGYWVRVFGYQDQNRVYGEVHQAHEDSQFTLGPTAEWQGGDAECEAELGYRNERGRFHRVAFVRFYVSG